MRRRSALISLVIAIFVSNFPIPAQAGQPLTASYLHSCQEIPTSPCIKSVTISKGGVQYKGNRTGRAATGTILYNQSVPLEQYGDEYLFSGLSFEGTSQNKIVTRVMYFPPGQQLCWPASGVCSIHKDFLEISAEPSWLSSPVSEREVSFPHLSNNLMCGSPQAPVICSRPLNFNQDIQINFVIQTPVDFHPVFAQARASQLGFDSTPDTNGGFSLTTISLSPRMMSNAIFSPLQPNPIQTNQYADFETDQVIAWIYGQGDDWTLSLGSCANQKLMTVSANALNIGAPTWDSMSQSINIKLDAQHYTSTGSVIAGYFQAVISRELGQCLWGIDLSTHVQARISLSYGGSGADVQTLTGNYKDGFYTLTANNFHYSSPLLSLRIQKVEEIKKEAESSANPLATPATPTPTARPESLVQKPIHEPVSNPLTPSKSSKASPYLTCVKANISIRISGNQTKCPKGYSVFVKK